MINEVIEKLPNNNDSVIVSYVYFDGVELECVYFEANQVFKSVVSGLIIPAYLVLEWQLKV